MPETRARLQLALEAGNLGTWEWDIRDARVRWSEALEAIHGLEPGTFEGTFEAYQRDIHPDDKDRVLATITESIGKGVHRVEYRIITPTGETRWLEARGKVLEDPDGRPSKMVGICADVTERREAEERQSRWRARREFIHQATLALTSDLDYDRTLAQTARLAVPTIADFCAVDLVEAKGIRRVAACHADPEKERIANEMYERHPPDENSSHGTTIVMRDGRPQLIEKISDELISEWARDEEHLRMLRALDLGSYMIVPMRARGALLGAISFLAEGDRCFGPDDLELAQQLAYVTGIAVDNAQSHRRLEEALRSREDLMAIVSHDLRSPLGTISLGEQVAREALAHGKIPRALSCLERIGRAANQMDRLIGDLLNCAAISSNSLSIDIGSCCLRALIREACDSFQSQAERKGVAIEYTLDSNVGNVEADRGRLQQVLCNLIGNALKFTEAGGRIEVSAEARRDAVRVSVSDTGTGISEDVKATLFEPYRRGEGRAEGVGLGLYISRGIVDAHGGKIWVESERGSGATFIFDLPMHR